MTDPAGAPGRLRGGAGRRWRLHRRGLNRRGRRGRRLALETVLTDGLRRRALGIVEARAGRGDARSGPEIALAGVARRLAGTREERGRRSLVRPGRPGEHQASDKNGDDADEHPDIIGHRSPEHQAGPPHRQDGAARTELNGQAWPAWMRTDYAAAGSGDPAVPGHGPIDRWGHEERGHGRDPRGEWRGDDPARHDHRRDRPSGVGGRGLHRSAAVSRARPATSLLSSERASYPCVGASSVTAWKLGHASFGPMPPRHLTARGRRRGRAGAPRRGPRGPRPECARPARSGARRRYGTGRRRGGSRGAR